MISVVIPLYNKEAYITETIQSVLEQTYTDFEVLVVDDGSTDGSIEKVKTIQDDRLKLIEQSNAGVSVARNNGIKNAQHAWIGFLDADDWWAPTFLEEMITAIKLYPNHVLFGSGRSLVYASEEQRYSHAMLPSEGETESLNYFKVISRHLPLLNSSNSVIKKSHFEKQGFFRSNQKKHEDHDLWMRLAVGHEVVFVNKNLSFYRKLVERSASESTYVASDFHTFLNTISQVTSKISEEEKPHVKTYVNRFALLTYIKNYGHYTRKEKQLLSPLLTSLLHGKNALAYRVTKWLPFNVYPILKQLKS